MNIPPRRSMKRLHPLESPFPSLFSSGMEMEADYIGLLLIASASYDPHVAPKVYEKLGEITGDSSLKDYLSTHPSSKKRSQLLSQAKVMDEALSIYREVVCWPWRRRLLLMLALFSPVHKTSTEESSHCHDIFMRN